MAKGKKEDPNKVAQRKAQRVAFVQSRPDLAPEVARKRFYVQTRAQELEAAGKPVDRAALRQKFETGGVTREGFYTPADIARINAKKNTNGESLAQSKTSTPQPVVPGAPVKPPTTTTSSAPRKRTPQRPPDRIENKVMIAGAKQTSPDVVEARKKVAARPMTPVSDAQFKAQVESQNAKLYEDLVTKFKGNEKQAQAAYGLLARGTERTSKVEDVLFGAGVSFKTAAKEATGAPQIARGVEGIKSGEGIKGKARGALDIGLGAFTLAGNLLMLKAGGQRLNARFQTKAITPRYELPAARGGVVESLEAGKNFKPTDARQTYYDYPAGPPSPPKSRLEVAADLQKKRAAEVEAAKTPSLHEAKQADLQKMVDETPLNIETPTRTKGKGGKGSKGKTKSTVEPAPVETTATKGKGGKGNKGKGKQTVAEEPMPDFGEMEGIVRFADDLASGQSTPRTRIDEIDMPDGSVKFAGEDFVFDEMSSVDRPTGDAYLYDPKADLGNLADIKAETKINYADIKAKTETPAVEVKGKGKGNKGGKGKNKSTVEPKPAETVATTPEAKPVKKKTTVELATQPRGRQSIAPSIELKQGTKPGQVMGQAEARMKPVPGEIGTLPSAPKPKQQVRSITQTVGSGTKADPFRSQTRQFVVEGTGAKGDPFKIVAEVKQGQSQLETFIPREAPTGTPRNIPEPPPEKVAQPKKPPARSRGQIEVKQYTPPEGKPVRISQAEAQRAVRIRERIARELEDNPFEAGVPMGQPKSALGRLDAMTQAQQTQKGGFWSHEKNRLFTPAELSAQADLEIAANAPNKAPSLADFKTSEQQLKDVKKYLLRNKAKGTLSPQGEAMLDKVLTDLFQIRNSPRMTAGSPQADRVRSYLQGRQRRGTLGEGSLKSILEGLNENLTQTVPRETVGKPKADLFARAQGMKDLSPKTKTPEMYLRAEKKHFADIRDLEIKLNDGSITRQQAQQLIQSYRSMWRASITQGQEAMWRTKVDALEERMTSFPVAPRGEQIKVKGKKGKNK